MYIMRDPGDVGGKPVLGGHCAKLTSSPSS